MDYSTAKYSKLESNMFNSPGYQPNMDYSPIEQIANSYSIQNFKQANIEYKSDAIVNYDLKAPNKDYETKPTTTYTHASVNDFLNPDRPVTRFVGKAEEIKHHIEEAFEKTTGKKLPQHITISVVKKEELKNIHEKNKGIWSEGIMGFAINKELPEIFARENNLDQLMLTIGHELGHVFTKSLSSKHNEEAKAFAFEIAWLKAIIENNIADLQNSFRLDVQPAKNGLHDIAFEHVKKWLKTGEKAIQIYWDLVKGLLKVESSFDYLNINYGLIP